MSMIRKVIRIVEDYVNASPFDNVAMTDFTLPVGSSIYHGTDRPLSSWNPEHTQIYFPAWFGLDFQVAKDYAKFARSSENGKPIVIEYVTTEPMRLLEASTPEIAELLDQLYDEYMTDEIAAMVLDLGYAGWHIKNTEIMLGDDAIKFIKVLNVD